MPSRWLALASGVDPSLRARQLRRSWEYLLAARELETESSPGAAPEMRPAIVDSWKRSLDTGLDPLDLLAPLEADRSEMRERWAEHPLGSLVHVLLAQLKDIASDSQSLIVVGDASGLLLHIEGPENLRARAAEMNFVEGARYSEAAAGTNGIGTVLAADHALQVFASEHFNERHHGWTCSGAPVHDPVSGRLVGVIDLSSRWEAVHPYSLKLATTAARTLEQCLADARHQHDARLRRRYADLATNATDLLVSPDGYVLVGERSAPSAEPLAIPAGGGEILLGDGSAAAAEPLGHGEAYLVRRLGFGAARAEPLDRAKGRADQRAGRRTPLPSAGASGPEEAERRRPGADSGRRARAYFEAALDCVVMVDASGTVVEFNPAAERTFGYSRDEALGQQLADLIVPPSLRERHNTAFARFVETRHGSMIGRRLELTGMRADGSEFPVELALSQVEPDPLLICGALRDLSVPKRAEHHLRELAEEQAALRRVATLVARESSPEHLFATVAEQVARVIRVPVVRLVRYEPDGSVAELIGGWAESADSLAPGTRWQLDKPGVLSSVWRTGRPARRDHSDDPGQGNAAVRKEWMRSAVASPITVEGRLWGAIAVLSPLRQALPEDTEARLADFTELVATALANAEARDGERRLTEEQAALRRVAELVAREPSQTEVFAAVADAITGLLGEEVRMVRYEADDAVVVAGSAGPLKHVFSVGSRVPLGGNNAVSRVFRTGKPVRIDDYREATGPIADTVGATGLRSVVATPIVVEGRLWGTMVVAAFRDEPIAPQTESRLAQFTELVATALANAESRAELAASEARARELAEEQAALRQVATLVAEGATADAVFSSVAREVAHVFAVRLVTVCRYEADAIVVLASLGAPQFPAGSRWPLDDPGLPVTIYETGSPARIDDYSDPVGLDALAREGGVRASVGVPIIVDGSVWGSINVANTKAEPFPPDAEERLARFTDLIATAISNATMRSELAASRARVIAAADDTRRRIERNLHDGAQQQLVTLALGLRTTEARVPAGLEDLRTEVGRFADRLTSVIEELREMSRGIHPAILTEGGLAPAFEALALRSPVPVKLDVRCEHRLPDAVEVAAYYVVSEALTNCAKHGDASRVEIHLHVEEGALHLSIVDDGTGGADPSKGTGLIGLRDRLEALGGTIDVASPRGGGTRLDVEIPLLASPAVATNPEQLSRV